MSEHSPIRRLKLYWRWTNLKYWVSVHLVRHKIGIEHFVSTQRTDRTGVSRDQLPQMASVNHACEADAQALINISRKRLCHCASPETTRAWLEVKKEVAKVEPELASCMVKECVYRGFCPEMFPCGYSNTKQFKKELAEYRKGYEQTILPKEIIENPEEVNLVSQLEYDVNIISVNHTKEEILEMVEKLL